MAVSSIFLLMRELSVLFHFLKNFQLSRSENDASGQRSKANELLW